MGPNNMSGVVWPFSRYVSFHFFISITLQPWLEMCLCVSRPCNFFLYIFTLLTVIFIYRLPLPSKHHAWSKSYIHDVCVPDWLIVFCVVVVPRFVVRAEGVLTESKSKYDIVLIQEPYTTMFSMIRAPANFRPV